MTALAKAFFRVFPGTNVGFETLKVLMIFGGVGLFVSLLLATNGLDMSAGFF
jgi:hypothetical protein